MADDSWPGAPRSSAAGSSQLTIRPNDASRRFRFVAGLALRSATTAIDRLNCAAEVGALRLQIRRSAGLVGHDAQFVIDSGRGSG